MIECLDEDAATALLRGRLGEAEVEAIEAHVDGCPDCFELLSTLARAEATEREPDEPRVRLGRGTTLGRYVLLEIVGVGAMGIVYAAYDPELDRRVALKLIHSEGRAKGAGETIAREARSMAQLRHPNVVTVFDMGSFGEDVFLAMELVVGTTLTAWLRSERRSTHEVLSAFIEAGRGLAAAHRAGIVHHDFKPDNVLVGESGDGTRRIAVTDFGLASVHGASPSVLSGTPYYMAPEQRSGSGDASADQYAFCVALYEALAGERRRGAVSKIAGVRPRITRAIARGLADAPGDRWPTMDALLTELASPSLRIFDRKMLVVALALLFSLLVVFGGKIERRIDCMRRARAIDRTWNVAEREAVERSMLGVGTPYAAEEWSRVERVVDRYVGATRAVNAGLCSASTSTDVHDLQASCLDAHLESVRGLLSLLKRGDPTIVRRATFSTSFLPRSGECVDVPKLLRRESSRLDPEMVGVLAVARILDVNGKYDEGEQMAEQAVKKAQQRGDRRAEARAFVLWGQLASDRGNAALAEERMERGERIAESVGADETRANALVSLMRVAFRRGDRAQVLALDERARLVIERIGGDDALEAMRMGNVAASEAIAGNYEAAFPLLVRANELEKRVYGERTSDIAKGLNDLGFVALELGDTRQARELLQEAIAIWHEAQGPRYPSLMFNYDNLGQVEEDEGRFDEARANYGRGLAIAEDTFGPDHPHVAGCLNSIGRLHTRLGKVSEALPLHLRALSIVERAFGKDDPRTQESLQSLGVAYFALGDRSRAIEVLSRAETLGEVSYPRFRVLAKFTLARALTSDDGRGVDARAMALATESLELLSAQRRKDPELRRAIEHWIQTHDERASR